MTANENLIFFYFWGLLIISLRTTDILQKCLSNRKVKKKMNFRKVINLKVFERGAVAPKSRLGRVVNFQSCMARTVWVKI